MLYKIVTIVIISLTRKTFRVSHFMEEVSLCPKSMNLQTS